MNDRLVLCFFALAVGWMAAPALAAERKPNVIFILADDLGWGDLGCYGHPHIKSPNLDRMARQGTLFTQFYVNGSVCSPSRCAFFTGQYPARHKIHGHYSTREMNERRGMSNFLDPQTPNLPRLLQGAGYATAHIGKWHLGNDANGPATKEYGFDFVGGTERGGANGPSDDPYYRAKSTGLFVDEAVKFIREHQDSPFYVQLWTLVPHATLNPLPEQMQQYAQFRAAGKEFPHPSAAEIFYSSVSNLDREIGRLLATLDELKISENTMLVFSSDNGTEDIHIRNAGHSGIGSAGPFRGRKRSLYEGGVRVPGIIRWPGKVPAGVVDATSILAGVDLLPTVCKLAGVTLPADHALDGEDQSSVFLGQPRARQKPLMWEWRFNIAGEPFHHSPQLAIREGDWKLLVNPDGSRRELYDMQRDLTQLENLAWKHPDLAARLSAAVIDWQRTLPPGPRDPNAGQTNYKLPAATR